MRCFKYYISCILILMCTIAYSQATFQVIESEGQYTYIEQRGINVTPINMHTPGIILRIPSGIKTVKICQGVILVFSSGQYISINQSHVDDSFAQEPPLFKYKKLTVTDYEGVTNGNEEYKTRHGKSWFYCCIEGEYATLYVAVRKKNVKKFIAPIVGERIAENCEQAAKWKIEYGKDRGEYYTNEKNHPGKKFSRKYIVHQ